MLVEVVARRSDAGMSQSRQREQGRFLEVEWMGESEPSEGRPAAFSPRNGEAFRRSDVECPYCHCLMDDLSDRVAGRTVQRLPSGRILVEMKPATHLAFDCPNCQQTFYAPKDREAFIGGM